MEKTFFAFFSLSDAKLSVMVFTMLLVGLLIDVTEGRLVGMLLFATVVLVAVVAAAAAIAGGITVVVVVVVALTTNLLRTRCSSFIQFYNESEEDEDYSLE